MGTTGWRKAERAYPFSPEQDALIRDGYKRLAERIGYPEAAVMLKRKRLRLKATLKGWTAHQLAEAMGEDGHKVCRWIQAGLLPAERLGTARTDAQHGDTYWIAPAALLAFLFDHPNEYDLGRVDKVWFLGTLKTGLKLYEREDTLP
jgi:hypothetical protein